MAGSQNLRADTTVYPAVAAAPRTAAHVGSKRARWLKLQLSTRLRAVRALHGLEQHDVHDRKQLVSDWESPHKPHAPNALHLLEQVGDPLSRPYALEVIACVLEAAEREERADDPRQLSLLDLIANQR
jgi:transcriptional regulator with XRE-family HTH domain